MLNFTNNLLPAKDLLRFALLWCWFGMKHRTEFLQGFERVIANGYKMFVGDEPMTTADRFYCRVQDALYNHENGVFLSIHSRTGEPKAFLNFRILDGEVTLQSFSKSSQVWFADFIGEYHD